MVLDDTELEPLGVACFQFNPVLFRLMPIILGFFELIHVPAGTRRRHRHVKEQTEFLLFFIASCC